MDKRIVANEVLLEEAAALMQEGRDVTFTPLGSSMLPFIRGGKDAVRLHYPEWKRTQTRRRSSLARRPEAL